MNIKLLMTCMLLGTAPVLGNAQTTNTGSGTNTNTGTNTGTGTSTGTVAPPGPHDGTDSRLGSPNGRTGTTTIDTRKNSMGTNNSNTGTTNGSDVRQDNNAGKGSTKVKRDKGEVKIKTEDANGKTKVEISRDGTTRITTDRPGEGKTRTISAPPAWAKAHNYNNDRAVYFPDYYMFYHPGRGYVYWNDGAWQVSQTAPEAYGTVDWSGARINVLNDVDLDVYPETTWTRYREMYPSRPVTIDVMVPQAQ